MAGLVGVLGEEFNCIHLSAWREHPGPTRHSPLQPGGFWLPCHLSGQHLSRSQSARFLQSSSSPGATAVVISDGPRLCSDRDEIRIAGPTEYWYKRGTRETLFLALVQERAHASHLCEAQKVRSLVSGVRVSCVCRPIQSWRAAGHRELDLGELPELGRGVACVRKPRVVDECEREKGAGVAVQSGSTAPQTLLSRKCENEILRPKSGLVEAVLQVQGSGFSLDINLVLRSARTQRRPSRSSSLWIAPPRQGSHSDFGCINVVETGNHSEFSLATVVQIQITCMPIAWYGFDCGSCEGTRTSRVYVSWSARSATP